MTATLPHNAEPIRRHRLPFYAILAANAVSATGNMLTYIAIPWFVLLTTGSAAKTGLTAFAGTLPLIVTGIFGGAIVDRVGAKRIAVLSDVASAAAVAAIPLLHHTVGLDFWQLLVLVTLGAVLDTPGWTARGSMYPDVAVLAGVGLERANALSQIIQRASQIIGPPLAGVLIALMGTSNVLWLDGISFLASAAIIALAIPAVTRRAPAESPIPAASFIADLQEGLRFIRRDRLILAMMVTIAFGAVMAEPLYAVVLPVYAKQQFGAAVDLGIMFAALGAGSLLGNVVYAMIGHRLPRRETFVLGWFVRAASFWLFITTPSLPVMVAAIAINGLCFEPGNPLFMTIMQERVPAELRGRVFGAFSSLSSGAMPLGLLIYGFLLEGIGLRDTLVVLAAINIIPVLTLLFLPAYRELRQPRPSGELTAIQPRT